MNSFIIVFAVAVFLTAVAAFIAVLLRVFPWNTNKAVKEMVAAAEVQGESKYIDREEAVYHVVRSRQSLAGVFLGFAALLIVCSTVIIISLMKTAGVDAKASGAVTAKSDVADEVGKGSGANLPALPKVSDSQTPQVKEPSLPANPASTQLGPRVEAKKENSVPPK